MFEGHEVAEWLNEPDGGDGLRPDVRTLLNWRDRVCPSSGSRTGRSGIRRRNLYLAPPTPLVVRLRARRGRPRSMWRSRSMASAICEERTLSFRSGRPLAPAFQPEESSDDDPCDRKAAVATVTRRILSSTDNTSRSTTNGTDRLYRTLRLPPGHAGRDAGWHHRQGRAELLAERAPLIVRLAEHQRRHPIELAKREKALAEIVAEIAGVGGETRRGPRARYRGEDATTESG